MEEVIASPFITFLFLLIYIQVTLEAPVLFFQIKRKSLDKKVIHV